MKKNLIMKRPSKVITFRGRFLGIGVLVVIQCINGIFHTFYGVASLLGEYIPFATSSTELLIYNYYTLAYGILTVFFIYLFWKGKRSGWIGTVAVALFVTIVYTLILFEFLYVPGIAKTAAIVGIPFNVLVLVYLLQNHIRSKYGI